MKGTWQVFSTRMKRPSPNSTNAANSMTFHTIIYKVLQVGVFSPGSEGNRSFWCPSKLTWPCRVICYVIMTGCLRISPPYQHPEPLSSCDLAKIPGLFLFIHTPQRASRWYVCACIYENIIHRRIVGFSTQNNTTCRIIVLILKTQSARCTCMYMYMSEGAPFTICDCNNSTWLYIMPQSLQPLPLSRVNITSMTKIDSPTTCIAAV